MNVSLICWRLSIAICLAMDDILIALVISNHLVKAHYRQSGRKEFDKPIMQLLGLYMLLIWLVCEHRIVVPQKYVHKCYMFSLVDPASVRRPDVVCSERRTHATGQVYGWLLLLLRKYLKNGVYQKQQLAMQVTRQLASRYWRLSFLETRRRPSCNF